MSTHGLPCWYELNASDLARDGAFYAAILPWTWSDAEMPGMTYMIATADGAMIAGMTAAQPGQPAGWTCYVAVDSADETEALAQSLGASPVVPPTDIPGTGRFALLLDPQGALFGLLQPSPGAEGGSFDQAKTGHGNWNELVTGDCAAAMGFYGKLFGWTISRSMEMGPGMTYHLIARNGVDIGGTFATTAGTPFWKPYFGVLSCAGAVKAVETAGGRVMHGPTEVPGGAFTLQVAGPDGTFFALVGPV